MHPGLGTTAPSYRRPSGGRGCRGDARSGRPHDMGTPVTPMGNKSQKQLKQETSRARGENAGPAGPESTLGAYRALMASHKMHINIEVTLRIC